MPLLSIIVTQLINAPSGCLQGLDWCIRRAESSFRRRVPTATCAKPSYCQMAKETAELLGVVAGLGGRSETKGGEGLDRSQSAHVAPSTPLIAQPQVLGCWCPQDTDTWAWHLSVPATDFANITLSVKSYRTIFFSCSQLKAVYMDIYMYIYTWIYKYPIPRTTLAFQTRTVGIKVHKLCLHVVLEVIFSI